MTPAAMYEVELKNRIAYLESITMKLTQRLADREQELLEALEALEELEDALEEMRP